MRTRCTEVLVTRLTMQVTYLFIPTFSKRKENHIGSEALRQSNKERRTPRAQAPCVLLTRVIKKGSMRVRRVPSRATFLTVVSKSYRHHSISGQGMSGSGSASV